MTQNYVYQFYAELEDFEPKIWRRFEIIGSKTMAELGNTLMLIFDIPVDNSFYIIDDRQKLFKQQLKETYTDEEIARFFIKKETTVFALNKQYKSEVSVRSLILSNPKIYQADEVTIHDASNGIVWELSFYYQYAHNWKVKLLLEKRSKKEVLLTTFPNVIDGEGFGIIDNIGGKEELKNIETVTEHGESKEFEVLSQRY